MELSKFIGNFELNESQIEKLIETYKKLNFRHDFYIYHLIWSMLYSLILNIILDTYNLNIANNEKSRS